VIATNMSIDSTTIVLCAGPINYTNLPISTNLSNAMIPVNGKPVIGWILDDLHSKGIRQIVVVLREEEQRLKAFLRRAYADKFDLHLATLTTGGTIVQSLQAGLLCVPSDGLIRIVLGDTLITDPFDGEDDFVYVGPVEDSRRWCLAVLASNGQVVGFVEKREFAAGPKLALAGYYHLVRGDHLRQCVDRSVASGGRELSDVLRLYGKMYPIQARQANEWYDFGNIDNFVEAKRRLLQPRYFNSLHINPVLNTITKSSADAEKIHDELGWYLQLPDELKVLTPRIVGYGDQGACLEIIQEYYGYPTLAELYVYGDLHLDTWLSILRRVLRVHLEFRRYPGSLPLDCFEYMYLTKTRERLALLRTQDPGWPALLDSPLLSLNGQSLRNLDSLWADLQQMVQRLARPADICIIHGDLCFSNILFDISNQIIRLIDPRGSFGQRGIYGDAKYDIAKLRHSVCGLYDYIISDMFLLEGEDNAFAAQVYVDGVQSALGEYFDQMIAEIGYDVNEIRLIEGLLFVSMVPLHHGHLQRQILMYLTGVSRLNEVLDAYRH